MAGRPPTMDGRKAKLGAAGMIADALDMASLAGVEIPASLGEFGRAEWGRQLGSLVRKTNLAIADLGSLELMCVHFEAAMLAKQTIDEREKDKPGSGYYSKTDSGYRQMSPEFVTFKSSSRDYLRFVTEFGGTPLARLRTTGTAQGNLFDWGKVEAPIDPTPTPIDPFDPYAGVKSGRVN